MATGSFKHNIVINDKRDAKALIDALENANKTKKSRRSVKGEVRKWQKEECLQKR